MKVQRKMKAESAALADAETDTLQDEVSAYASQLGLSAGTGAGFDDSDFRPEVAKQQIGTKGKAKKKAAAHQDEDEGERQQRVTSNQRAGPSGRNEGQRGMDSAKMSAVQARKWNTGSGTRPGEKAGKTLQGKDEPTIWHEALASLPALPKQKAAVTIDDWALEKLRNEGEAALENEAKVFEQDLGRQNKADSRWLQQVKQSGTTADKLAALTLLIQESAVANIKSLDELMRWVGKRSGARGVAGQAMDALKELFSTVLLPNRKLLFFEQQPLAALPAGGEGRHRLMYYYMEDAIKKRYLQFVKDLQEASRDNLDFIKEKALKGIYDLLRSNPEQEALLLSALVDKLGDPSRKIASNAGYLLGQLLEEHPAMGLVVVQETERFLFKPYTQAKAVYYSVVFLNQIVLSKRRGEEGSAVAKKLIGLYFTLFKLILQGKIGQAHELQAKKEEQDAQKGGKGGPKKKRWKDRSSSKTNGKGGQAKPQKAAAQARPDTQVAAVDAKLLGALLAGVRRAFPFVAAADTEALMEAHSAALFTVTHTATFGVSVQALSLVFQLLDARSAVSDRFYRALYGMLLHPELARSNKSSMFLSLIYKAVMADVSSQRIVAFIKRLLQVASGQAPNFTCGCLLLISEVMKDKPSLWNYITEPEEADDALEQFQDESSELETGPVESNAEDDAEAPSRGTLSAKALRGKLPHQAYDMYKRDPKYSGADRSCMWELVMLAEHVHPSVAAMTKALLAGLPIDYAGDPIRDMSTSAFLDKFIQKKPKVQPKGRSLMQPLAKPDLLDIGTPAFAALSAADAAPDTAYFHKFFEVKAAREAAGVRPAKKRKRAKEEEEEALGDEDDSLADSDAASEEIDDFLDQAEESEEELGGYDQLASAMAVDAPPDGDSSESEAEVLDSDEENLDGSSGEAVDSDIDGLPAESASEGEDSEEVDVFKLAGPSDEDSESDPPESSASDDEWIMATPGLQRGPDATEPQAQGSHGTTRVKTVKGSAAGRPKKKGKAASVFASAEDYAELIQADKPITESDRKRRQK